MANKALKDIKNLSKDELNARARELEGQLFQAKMQKATGQLANTALLGQLRKTLARVKTIESQSKAGK